jgi:hypothetical protein
MLLRSYPELSASKPLSYLLVAKHSRSPTTPSFLHHFHSIRILLCLQVTIQIHPTLSHLRPPSSAQDSNSQPPQILALTLFPYCLLRWVIDLPSFWFFSLSQVMDPHQAFPSTNPFSALAVEDDPDGGLMTEVENGDGQAWGDTNSPLSSGTSSPSVNTKKKQRGG